MLPCWNQPLLREFWLKRAPWHVWCALFSGLKYANIVVVCWHTWRYTPTTSMADCVAFAWEILEDFAHPQPPHPLPKNITISPLQFSRGVQMTFLFLSLLSLLTRNVLRNRCSDYFSVAFCLLPNTPHTHVKSLKTIGLWKTEKFSWKLILLKSLCDSSQLNCLKLSLLI